MGEKPDVWQGTLALMVLRTLETLGPLHGYGMARRIEQTSGDQLQLNYGTLYPALLKLEQEGFIRSHWGVSENNRRAKFYELTKAGQRPLLAGHDAPAPGEESRGRVGAGHRDPGPLPEPGGGGMMPKLRAFWI